MNRNIKVVLSQTICICDKCEVITVHIDEPLDDVDLLYALLHGVLVLPIAAKIRGPELKGTM